MRRPIHLLTGVPPSCHFKLVWMLLCMLNYMCRGVCGLSQSLQWCSSVCCKSYSFTVSSQCGADSSKFLQWHSSVGLFQLSFSSGVPVYTGSTSGIPVYTGPASVHWLRVRGNLHVSLSLCESFAYLNHLSWNETQMMISNMVLAVLKYHLCIAIE